MQLIINLLIMIIGLFLMTGKIIAYEEPKYKILEKNEDIEIREYTNYIVAETIVREDFEDAGNEAFSSLFGYIGGKNISQESIEMTTPVRQEKVDAEGQEIEMTVPVTQESVDSGQYRVSFVMPSRFTLATLPKPKDERVQLREIPAKKVAVIRYSGTWSKENYEENESLLLAFISNRGYKIEGNPVWARYNSPFTPWFMRRNEIMIEIQ